MTVERPWQVTIIRAYERGEKRRARIHPVLLLLGLSADGHRANRTYANHGRADASTERATVVAR